MTHNASKFSAVDNGTVIQVPSITKLQTGAVGTPTNISIAGHVVITQGIATNVMTISWTAPSSGAAYYEVQWQRDNGQWVNAGTAYGTSFDVSGIYTGTYVARVTAYNSAGDSGTPGTSSAFDITGKTGAPPVLTSLTTTSEVFAIKLDWGFPAGAEDTAYTEIYYGSTPSIDDAQSLGMYAYPTNTHTIMGLAAGVSLFFWGRLIDKTGNVGAWYPDGAGVNGQSSSDATEILDYLTGQITATQLSQDLNTKIDTIEDLAPLAWDSTSTYNKGDTTYYNGVIYAWTSDTAGNEEPPGTDGNWQDVGTVASEYGALVGEIEQNTTSITSLNDTITA